MSTAQSLGREQKKAISRRRILESAREIFFRDGFMAANLDHVAQSAGVAKGTRYRYFESKAELYVAVLAEDGEIFEHKLRETVVSSLSATDQIRTTSRFYFDHWTNNRHYFQIFWAIENQSIIGELPTEVLDQVVKLWESCLQVLADVIDQGVKTGELRECDPWEMANILWTMANGLLQIESSQARSRLLRRSLDGVFEDALSLFIRGISSN